MTNRRCWSLENLLRRQRHVWDMAFAPGGEAAVAELERAPADVVVTDMKMPGMDGPALLEVVRDRWPGAARIVMSGQAGPEAALRVIPVAHQYLAKPCASAVLLRVLERACTLQARISNGDVRSAIGRLRALPSAPESYWELTRRLNDPDVSLGALARIVEDDPAMAAKVLQLANSAYFGLRRTVTSVLDAVRYLGVDLLTALLLTAKVFTDFWHATSLDFSVTDLQARALRAARICRLLAAPAIRDEAYAAALLMDVGQLILATGMPDRFARVARTARETGTPLHLVESAEFGVSHAEVGAYLLGVWGLPISIVEAVAFHHRPSLVAAGSADVLAVVHATDALVDSARLPPDAPIPGLDRAFMASVGWADAVRGWHALVALELGDGVAGGPAPRPSPPGHAH